MAHFKSNGISQRTASADRLLIGPPKKPRLPNVEPRLIRATVIMGTGYQYVPGVTNQMKASIGPGQVREDKTTMILQEYMSLSWQTMLSTLVEF